ncbi:hypothetical protein FRACYDRAFT_194734, partial [Fragilariopsis cylindrus CCMP1102]
MASAKNAAKKAAKKAEKEAKKAAFKAGIGNGGEGSGGAPSVVVAAAATDTADTPSATKRVSAAKINNAKAIVSVLAAVKGKSSSGGGKNGPPPLTNLSKFKLKPFQLVINPNVVRMNERPIITLAVACLCDFDIDLTITSDHRVPQSMLGDSNGQAIVGDLASARYLLDVFGGIDVSSSSSNNVLTTSSSNERAEQNAWIEYSQSLLQLNPEQARKGIAMTLEHALSKRTYLCGHKISLADIALFAALGFPCTIQDKKTVLESLNIDDYPIATRWTKMMCSHPALMKATQLAVGAASGATA